MASLTEPAETGLNLLTLFLNEVTVGSQTAEEMNLPVMVEEVVVAQFYGSVHLKTHPQRLLVYQLVYHALHELRIARKIHDHGTSHKFVRPCRGRC